MTNAVFTAKEKTTGRTWIYQTRRTFGRLEFRFALSNGSWSPTLSGAKTAAKEIGRFRYNDEPALVTVAE